MHFPLTIINAGQDLIYLIHDEPHFTTPPFMMNLTSLPYHFLKLTYLCPLVVCIDRSLNFVVKC